VYLICSIAAFKARNNRISDQNHSKTAQNAARFLENNIFAHSVIAVPGFIRKKKMKTWCTQRVASLPRAWENDSGQQLEIVVIRNAP